MNELYLVTGLTVGAIVLNVIVAIRALAFAMALESGCRWVCQQVGTKRVIRIMQGLAMVCIILAVLKSWSIADVFTDYWHAMSDTYHLRAFAYLGENYGVPMLGYAMISVFQLMSGCTTSKRFIELQEKVIKDGQDESNPIQRSQ